MVAMFGGVADDYQTEIDLLPSIVDAFNVFSCMSTQWRVGFGGRTGLDYAALPVVMDMLGTDDRPQMFDDLRVMELAALKALAEFKNHG